MIKTKLTEFFGIDHPIILAPMTPASGAELACSVAEAGGLGLLGGGYGDRTWFETESAKVTRDDIGVGFITWSVANDLDLLDLAMRRHRKAVMLSFANPKPIVARIRRAGVPLICQVHTVEQALGAAEVGADVIVAQGTEAGGHGQTTRSTMPFVPTVVDALAQRFPGVIVVAAGGIGDGRGLAAALMLGADGVLMGSRFWATQESLIHHNAKDKVVAASGDETIRTSVYDIVRQRAWPAGYTGRLMRNAFIEKWHGREDELRSLRAGELAKVEKASRAGDYDTANVTVGESIGLIHDLPRAKDLVRRIAEEAAIALGKFAPRQAASVA